MGAPISLLRRASRHGDGERPLGIDQFEIAAPAQDEEWLALSDALEKLEARDKPKAQFVKLRYFVNNEV
jgi:hypothetical protein